MKKFFSRAELIHLARRSDYVGAAIIPPRPWNRKVVNPVLLSLKNLQEALSPDKVQAIAQLNLEDSVAMISPRDQTPRGVINSGVSNATPVFSSSHGSEFAPSNLSNNNAVYKTKDEMSIDSRYSSMPNSGRSQYSDYQGNMSMNSNTMSLNSNNNTPRFNYGSDNQFQHQQQQSQQNLQHGQRGNNYNNYNAQSSHHNNMGMYGNNRQQYHQQQQQQPHSQQQYSSNNNQRYGSNVNQNANYPPPSPPDGPNYGSSPYQSSAHHAGSVVGGNQANFYSGNGVPSAATSRQSISGIPAPNIVNGQVLNPYVPAPVDNKMKKPMVPPIPLQGISSKPMMSNNNNMQNNDGSWSQRSAGWTNEGTYTDRYNSSMTSSRSDYSSAPGAFPQSFGKVKSGMDNMSPMVSGRSSDSDGMDHYGSRAGQGNVGNYYSNQMGNNNNSGMFNTGFQQQQQQQPIYDNSGNIGGNGGYNARNNRSANYGASQGYNNSNFSNNNANNSNTYQQPIHGQSWDGAPDSSRSWNGAQSSYDFGGSSRVEDQKSFNIPQGGGHNHNPLWMGSNPNTARSNSSAAGDFSNRAGVDDFSSNNNYQSRKSLPGMDNNNANARFY